MRELIEPPFVNDIKQALPWKEYLAARGANPSRLVDGIRSMKHFKVSDQKHDKPERNKLVGSATHTLVFETTTFKDRYAVWDGPRRQGNEYKDFCAEHADKEILKADEAKDAMETADAILSDSIARDYLKQIEPEVSLFCEDFGVQCKGRVDGLGEILLDLKTTTNAEMYAFGRVFANLKYASKLACYRRWARRLGASIEDVYVICAETSPPYDVTVVPIPDIVLDNAWPRMEQVLKQIPECIERDHWPGVAEGELYELHVPNWSMDEDAIVAEFQG